MHGPRVLYDYAMAHVGLPYIWGGDDSILGYDCSGLVIELLRSQGLFPQKFDTTAHGIMQMYAQNKVDIPSLGTLVFYGSERKITHVAMCLNPYTMIEAGGGGASITSDGKAAEANAFIRVRPIKFRDDFIAYCHPPYKWSYENVRNG